MPKKDPFEDLEPTLKASLEAMSDEDIRKKVSEVALYKQAQTEAMKADPDIQQRREALNSACKDYKDEIKGSDLQIRYIKSLLEGRGKL